MVFIPNTVEIRKLAEDPSVLDGTHEIAKALADEVVRGTPVDTGRMARSIRVRRSKTGSRVESTDPFWHLIEWGSINNAPYQPMTRAAAAFGRFIPTSA